MLQWFRRLMPRQDAFFPAFERHAAVMVKAAVALRAMVAGGDQLKPRFQDILDLEHEADGIAREVLLGLRTDHPELFGGRKTGFAPKLRRAWVKALADFRSLHTGRKVTATAHIRVLPRTF